MKFISSVFIRALFLLFLMYIFSSSVLAQKNFLPGKVVLRTGDTLKGFINEIPGRISPRTINFKSTLASEAKSYSATEVNWFRYDGGEWYFGYIGSLESSTLNTNELTYDSSMHALIDTLFIRAVIIGRASLYYARDRSDRIHLLMQKFKGEITELAYKKYYVDEIVVADYRDKITRRAVYENQMYKGQLIQAFHDCPYIATGITQKQLPYAKNDLEALFESYNRCKGAKVAYHEPKDNGKAVIVLNAGVNFSKLTFESSSYPPWNDYHFDPSIGWAVGIGMDFLLPRTQGKWGFFNEFSLKSFRTDGDSSYKQNVLKLDLLHVKWALMMRYYITSDKRDVRPYFSFGITNAIAIKDVNVNYGYYPEGEPILAFRDYETGLMAGFGIFYKRLNGELRYERSNGISGYTSLNSPMRTIYVLIGYKLFEL